MWAQTPLSIAHWVASVSICFKYLERYLKLIDNFQLKFHHCTASSCFSRWKIESYPSGEHLDSCGSKIFSLSLIYVTYNRREIQNTYTYTSKEIHIICTYTTTGWMDSIFFMYNWVILLYCLLSFTKFRVQCSLT